ncbi:MAG: hypothetical protein ABSG92_02320 [Conexivisphaerales archaeon]|jgi:virginiamycin B lyase
MKRSKLLLAILGIVLIGGGFAWGILSVASGKPQVPAQSSCGPSEVTDTYAGYITEYRTPEKCASPNGITVDAQGRVWFVEQNISKLAMFDPSTQNFTEYQLPVTQPITWGMTTTVDGDIWMTDANSSSIIRFDAVTSKFTQYAVNSGSFPLEIITGPDGALWFSELYGHAIGRIQPDNGLLTQYPLSSNGTGPSGITFGLNDTLWISLVSFNQSVPNSLATLDPSNGVFRYYEVPTAIAQPTGIVVDRSGNVWFAEHGPSLLGRYDPTTGQLIEVATSRRAGASTSLPYWLVEDSSGDIWFNEHEANRIAHLDPITLTLTEYDIPSRVPSYGNISNALTIALGTGGNLWFTELSTSKIGVVNASMTPDLSVSGPASWNVSFSSALMFNLTSAGKYSGGLSFEATDSELPSGLLQSFTVSFSSPTYLLNANASAFSFNATVTIVGSPLLGDYYVTFTVRETGVASSKIVVVHLVPPP